MPLVRKVVDVGKARAVVLPAEWLRYFERAYGSRIEEVTVEVDDELRIRPILSKKS